MFFQIAPVTNKEMDFFFFFFFFFFLGGGGGVGEIYFTAHHSRFATTRNFSETLKFTLVYWDLKLPNNKDKKSTDLTYAPEGSKTLSMNAAETAYIILCYWLDCYATHDHRINHWLTDRFLNHQWVTNWVSEWVSEWVCEWESQWVSESVSQWVSQSVIQWVSQWVS